MLENDDDKMEGLLRSENSGEIINTNTNINTFDSKDSSEEQVDQDKIIVDLREFKAEYTNVTSILDTGLEDLREKDKFDVIKFTIKVKAVYNYEWEVYRRPSEVKKNFADIHNELSKNFMGPSGNKADIFTTVANWPEDSLQIHINEIENYYKILFVDPKIYNTLHFKEFFNITFPKVK